MPFNRPTLQTLVNRIAGDFKSYISGATTLALRSVLQVFARVYAGAVNLVYGYIDNFTKMFFASTAIGTWLDLIGSELGVLRLAATAAGGNAVVTGTTGTIIPVGSALTSTAGNRYVTTAAIALALGTGVINVLCDTLGTAANDSAGISLTFSSPIVGVNSVAVVDSNGLTGGTNVETDDAYRVRVLSRKRYAPHGGTAIDLVTWAEEVSGVTRAWAQSGYMGDGTVAVFFVDDAQVPITPSASQVAVVLAYLQSHVDTTGRTVGAPVTMWPGLFVMAPQLATVNFAVNIYPNTTAVQTAVLAELSAMMLNEAAPGATLYKSTVDSYISAASGQQRHSFTSTGANTQGDIPMASNQLPVLGTVVFNNY